MSKWTVYISSTISLALDIRKCLEKNKAFISRKIIEWLIGQVLSNILSSKKSLRLEVGEGFEGGVGQFERAGPKSKEQETDSFAFRGTRPHEHLRH